MIRIYRDEPVFFSKANLFTNCTVKEMCNWLHENGYHKIAHSIEEDDANFSTTGLQHSGKEHDGKQYNLIWLEKIDPNDVETFGDFWHEIFHLATQIAHDKNIQLDMDGANEAIAYIGGFYFTEFLKALKQQAV